MANNSTIMVASVRTVNFQVILIQVLVCVFLCINLCLIVTFFMKEYFYTVTRYILFVVMLFSDSLFLIMTDMLLVFTYFSATLQIWLCLIIYIVLSVYTFVTPLTLTAMVLERYVAICIPLRHAEVCTMRATLYLILIVHSLSSVPCVFILSVFFALAPRTFYSTDRVCSVEMFILSTWHGYMRAATSQIYFLVMSIIIVYAYLQIMKVAKAASGQNKKSTRKGLRTVILHSFQLLLCLLELFCPFIEDAVRQTDFTLFVKVRYFNYVTFIIAPRCLSPLIYGLRDDLFFQAIRYYALCGLYKKNTIKVKRKCSACYCP